MSMAVLQMMKKSVEETAANPPCPYYLNRPFSVKGEARKEIGIEFEVEAEGRLPIEFTKSRDFYWGAKRDNSLRGESKEYVLVDPVSIGSVRPAITFLWDEINKKARLFNSNRCSTHVHLNTKSSNLIHLTSFIVLWGVFEELLINLQGEERKTNHFCLSFKQTPSTVRAWTNVLKGRRNDLRYQENLKYSTLNIATIATFGSIEIRCGKALEDPEEIIDWVTFLYYFFEYTKNSNLFNPVNIPFAISERGPLEILREICETCPLLGERYYNRIIEANGGDPYSISRECLEGFRRVQHLCYDFPWDAWVEKSKIPFVPDPFVLESKFNRLKAINPLHIAEERVGE